MEDYGAYQSQVNFYIEAFAAAAVMIVFVVVSMATLRERHRDTPAWHVNLGAAIYGAILGVVIGFVIVPLRMSLTQGTMPPQTAGVSTFAALALVIALRRGLIAQLPFLGPQVKAYRRASLRRQIEIAQKQLDKLTGGKKD
ncbi:MAG: hypothetical protein R3C58_01310 [Parvularculaceae bacterium]